MSRNFNYLGHTFTPQGNYPKKFSFQEITERCKRIGIHNYDGGVWSHDEFYQAAKAAGCTDQDLFVMDSKILVIPCENELFEWTGLTDFVPVSSAKMQLDAENQPEAEHSSVTAGFIAGIKAKKSKKSSAPKTRSAASKKTSNKKVVVVLEVEIDENQIVRKYPNFSINYNVAGGKPTKQALLDFANRFVEEEENSLEDFGFSVKIVQTEIAPTDTPKMLMVDKINSCGRTLSFGRENDPYIITHPDSNKLDDSIIKPLYDNWCAAQESACCVDTEAFESFLAYLENEKGYGQIHAAQEMLNF